MQRLEANAVQDVYTKSLKQQPNDALVSVFGTLFLACFFGVLLHIEPTVSEKHQW